MLSFNVRKVTGEVSNVILNPRYGTESRERFHVFEAACVPWLQTLLEETVKTILGPMSVEDQIEVTIEVKALGELVAPERESEEPEEAPEEVED